MSEQAPQGSWFSDFGQLPHHEAQVLRRACRVGQSLNVAVVAIVNFDREDQLGIQVDAEFRFLDEVRAALLQLRDPRVAVGRRHALVVREDLVFPLLVEPAEVVIARLVVRFDHALISHQPRKLSRDDLVVSKKAEKPLVLKG